VLQQSATSVGITSNGENDGAYEGGGARLTGIIKEVMRILQENVSIAKT
jgi:hypothetical protein